MMMAPRLLPLALAALALAVPLQSASAQYSGQYRARYDEPTRQQVRAFQQGRPGVFRSQVQLPPAQATLVDAEALAQIARARASIGTGQFRATTQCDRDVNIGNGAGNGTGNGTGNAGPGQRPQPTFAGNVTVVSVRNCVGGRSQD